jgi:hypothetical protein
MELILNELSILKSESQYAGGKLAMDFAKTMGTAVSMGYRKIRSHLSESEIELAHDYTLYNWLVTNSGDAMIEQVIKPFLYGVFTTPFIEDGNEIAEEQYIESDFYFEDIASGFPKAKCLGLASAFIADSISISFPTLNIWKKEKLTITIEYDDEIVAGEVLNIHSTACFKNYDTKTHIVYNQDLKLTKHSESPKNKKCHITSHHGQKELKQLWNKLKTSPYVVSGLSIEWGGKVFVRKAEENGKIEIVLYKSEREYSLQIETTGTNQRETEEIAKILTQKFDR